MVLLVAKISKLYSKLENHHHHHRGRPQSEAFSASLQAFRSDVSSSITRLLLNSKPGGLEIMSLEWIQECFQVLPFINKAFAKLVVEIDYHMSEWKAKSMEAYLKYSLDLLDLLNSISSSLSYLGQIRLALSHALSLVESSPSSGIERLEAIELKRLGGNEFKHKEKKEDEKETSSSDKEEVVFQALMELRGVGLWLCSIVLAGLSGDAKVFLEMRKSDGVLSNPSLLNLDSSICGVVMEKGCVLKDVKELKDSAAFLAAAIAGKNSSDAAEELRRKMEVFEKMLDGLGKEVNLFFSEVLAWRNELLDGIRFRK